jgi:hypothetical protein
MANWTGWHNMLPQIRAENENWREKHLPHLKARDAERKAAREAQEREEAEQRLALQWCRANGNPHHRQIDLLVTDLLCNLGYGEGMQKFLDHALPYHSKDPSDA